MKNTKKAILDEKKIAKRSVCETSKVSVIILDEKKIIKS